MHIKGKTVPESIAEQLNEYIQSRLGDYGLEVVSAGLAEIKRLEAALDTCRELREFERPPTAVVQQFDNMVGHIVGINDERDVIPLLLGLRKMWPQVRAEIEKLSAALETCRELREYDRKEIERRRSVEPRLREGGMKNA